MKKQALAVLAVMVLLLVGCYSELPVEKLKPVPTDTLQQLKAELTLKRFRWGAPVYVRVFKQESILEVWLQKDDGQYARFNEYPICTYSGELGPKLKEGDKQSPEGFYEVGYNALNPKSKYHLSFNLGFPNQFDRAHGYTGSYLMVHGDCVSVGCYAMGDKQIEQIYILVAAALQHGQRSVPVHIYPFKMTQRNMLSHQANKWMGFWQQLKPAYDFFEQNHLRPVVKVVGKRYQFDLLESVTRR